jgi:dTDP-4-amino-4,6-dideoxygalactose transaminase
MKYPLSKVYITGRELEYISEAVKNGKLSGNGVFTKQCHSFFKAKFGFKNALLTSSCTDALEMAAILLDIKQGDEVILPSYTFVSTANAFVLRGANVLFADSKSDSPNIDCKSVETLISGKTKAIVCVHYAGISCDMDELLKLSEKYNIPIVEDAAHALGSTYQGKPLGTFGAMSTFSFHDTKNITCGEGGLLLVSDDNYWQRAEIVWEKGTNRSQFTRGEVNKYEWIDVGSSFLPSELAAAFLYAQLEAFDSIQAMRGKIWKAYFNELESLSLKGYFDLPLIQGEHSSHLFYIVCKSLEDRNKLKDYLNEKGIGATFHYLPLQSSPFYLKSHPDRKLPQSERFFNGLLRLPLYPELDNAGVNFIISQIYNFFKEKT